MEKKDLNDFQKVIFENMQTNLMKSRVEAPLIMNEKTRFRIFHEREVRRKSL